MADFVGAIDQGTTSTRFMIFDHGGDEVGQAPARARADHAAGRLGRARPGRDLGAHQRRRSQTALARAGLQLDDLAAIGITNQRETTVVWNRRTGRPYYNAIVWQDTRTDHIASALDRDGRGDVIRHRAGLPPATYFSGGKLQWILENVDGVRAAAERGDAIFGTTDTWLLWNLTGGVHGGVHVTDVTNASRTMLMDLETLDWDDELLAFFGVPRAMLPQIRPSSDSEPYGRTLADGPVGGEVPLTGVLGDQQAAMVGQVCCRAGRGEEHLRHRQLPAAQHRRRSWSAPSTACSPRSATSSATSAAGLRPRGLDRGHRLGGAVAARPARHHQRRRARARALARAGRRTTAASTSCRPSPACSRRTGAPTPAARSSGCPASTPTRTWPGPRSRRSATRAATSPTRWRRTPGSHLEVLKVDGGVTANDLCMQIQADILGVAGQPAGRRRDDRARARRTPPGLAVGFWKDPDELRQNWNEDQRWSPAVGRGAARRRLRRLEEGRPAHPGLGGRLVTRAPSAVPARPRTATGPSTRTHPGAPVMTTAPLSPAGARTRWPPWPSRSSTSSSSAAA